MADDTMKPLGVFNLNGEDITVGVYSCKTEDCIYIQSREMAEPVYISATQADLFIAALQVAKEYISGK